MMGFTHVFIGTMTAVILTEPKSTEACLAALIGGSLGGIISDIDLGIRKQVPDTERGGWLAGMIVLACFAMDLLWGGLLIRSIRNGSAKEIAAGVFGLVLLWFWGRAQPHRGGTHSILALVLFSASVDLICAMMSRPFLIGMASHLVLDMLNRKPIQLFYPLRGGWCAGISRANDRLDRWLRTVGLWGTVLGIGVCIGRMI